MLRARLEGPGSEKSAGLAGLVAAGLPYGIFGGLAWQSFSADILLTSLSHVNWLKAGFTPRRIQNAVLGRFLSKPFALGLTVSHKTVAEIR
jgi:hypothetical protein